MRRRTIFSFILVGLTGESSAAHFDHLLALNALRWNLIGAGRIDAGAGGRSGIATLSQQILEDITRGRRNRFRSSAPKSHANPGTGVDVAARSSLQQAVRPPSSRRWRALRTHHSSPWSCRHWLPLERLLQFIILAGSCRGSSFDELLLEISAMGRKEKREGGRAENGMAWEGPARRTAPGGLSPPRSSLAVDRWSSPWRPSLIRVGEGPSRAERAHRVVRCRESARRLRSGSHLVSSIDTSGRSACGHSRTALDSRVAGRRGSPIGQAAHVS